MVELSRKRCIGFNYHITTCGSNQASEGLMRPSRKHGLQNIYFIEKWVLWCNLMS